ncbi:ABC transporter permease [Bacillota bacterium]
MRTRAVAMRIINQLRHDPRTLGLVLLAPLLMLTLLYLILGSSSPNLTVGIVNAPQGYVERLDDYNIKVLRCTEAEGLAAIEDGKIIGMVSMVSGKAVIHINGENPSKASGALAAMNAAAAKNPYGKRTDLSADVNYIYGAGDLTMFDSFGPMYIGFIIFFYVFLISGISFLQDRTTGTLEKLLSTPVKRWEIVMGYVMGYGLITLLQSVLITLVVIYVLDGMMVGSMWLVLLVTLLSAMSALTLGIFLSTAASSEFQMIQFIPLVIIPQIFFSGLFDLSPAWNLIGKFMPIYYVADALNKIMIKGDGFAAIALDTAWLIGSSILFIIGNTVLLKRYRKI